MRGWVRSATAAATLLLLANAAADPADQLKNPAQEARARALFRQIRCVVCQSESIDESDADIARDLRQMV
jgi:cytochrome c-type biogenesis protein CcmH